MFKGAVRKDHTSFIPSICVMKTKEISEVYLTPKTSWSYQK